MAETPRDLPSAHVAQLDSLASTYWWHTHRVALTAQLLRRHAPARGSAYLDVGCGPGATTRLIADRLKALGLLDQAAAVCGADADASAGAASRRHGVAFFQADLQAEALAVEGRFDRFTILDVLEHLESPRRLLTALAARLSPGAVGVVSVPAFPLLYSDWDRAFGHHRRYRTADLSELLADAGYEVLWCGYAFGYAFVPALVSRKLLGGGKSVEFPAIPAALNAALTALGAAERLWLRWGKAPFGTSAFAAVRYRA